MTKDIKYSGYTAVPSDYECADGELAASLNLINENGALHNISQPSEIPGVNISGYNCLIIHSVAGQKNIILSKSCNKPGFFELAWIIYNPNSENEAIPQNIELPDEPLCKFKSIAIIGNTICICDAFGVHYILWKNNEYHYLGIKPPFVEIAFLSKYDLVTTETNSTTSYHKDDVPPRVQSMVGISVDNRAKASGNEATFWKNNIANQALGLLLKTTAEKAAEGRIYQPCYIRYAFRLYDGTYYMHSAPVLIGLTDSKPAVYLSGSVSDDTCSIYCKTEIKFADIAYKIGYINNDLQNWKDIVMGIDIFMSAPIYTFDQDSINYGLTSIDGLKIGYKSNQRYSGRGDLEVDDSDSDSRSNPYQYIDFITHPQFHDKVCSESQFYKIATLEFEDIKKTENITKLALNDKNLTNLTTRESLTDDFNSHASILPDSLSAYNSRLFLSGLRIQPARPFRLFSSAEYVEKNINYDEEFGTWNGNIFTGTSQVIHVFSIINGVACISYTDCSGASPECFPLDKKFPRFLYHPDPNAYKMRIQHANGTIYELNLKPHPFLNGAYWFGGIGEKPENITLLNISYPYTDQEFRSSSMGPVEIGRTIYSSPVNNPFIFPPENSISIEATKILGTATAAKALSQGQFGQFPLYAFADTGVWAMEISSTGSIAARQPITRDVCISPESITQIDSAVLFTSDRGIMLLSGSETTCISNPINNPESIKLNAFPGLLKIIHSNFPNIDSEFTEIAPFLNFLSQKSRILYEYVTQRIIVFNPDFPYAYVYSMKSKLWGMMLSNINQPINSYPETLAINTDGKLVTFSNPPADKAERIKSFFISRPLKLGLHDILKTIDSIIQRGNFAKGNVQSVLYASRDLINWHLVWSSKDHFLRGFRGSPYKYFRIALLCNLAQGESISGASVQFTPRLTNKPR